jgi:hypothetical protein
VTNNQPTKKMTAQEKQALQTIEADLADINAIGRLTELLRNPAALAESPIFLAYCALPFGPENDWNSERSTSLALKRRWEFEVLAFAQHKLHHQK